MRFATLKRVAMVAMMAGVSFTGFSIGSPAAQAHEGGPPAACRGFFSDFGETCFEWSGDDQWVYRAVSGSWNPRVQIETNYGKTRWCANTHGADTWHECTFDHDEDGCVRFRMFEQLGNDNTQTRRWTVWSPWVSISTGATCTLDA
jgi:hypothetical protein